jgi:ribonuclease P protein component
VAASSTAFTRASRLISGQEFSRVFAGASRSADPLFTVLGRPNDQGHPRLVLAISKRVAPRAVDRNRLKRLVRESFRQLPLAPLDYVVMARRDAIAARNDRLRASLDRHFLRLSRRAGAD